MLADKLRAASLTALPLPVFVSSSVVRSGVAANTVTAPTGIQDGDLLIAVGFTSVTLTLVAFPSGFSIFSESYTNANGVFVATKTAASESGDYSFTWSGNGSNAIAILVYRAANTINVTGGSNATATTTGSADSVTPTFKGALVGVFGASGGGDTVVSATPSGSIQRVLLQNGLPCLGIYDLLYQEAEATASYSLVWSNATETNSFLLQITNEPDVAPEFVASASTQNVSPQTTLVINKPIGTVEGDLMVAVMATDDTVTWTGDTGWTEVADLGTRPCLRVAYMVAGASEGANYTFTATVVEFLAGSILTYRYAAYDTVGTFATGTNPLVLPSISPAESQCTLIAVGARRGSNTTLGTPTGMTGRVTDNDATSPSYIICDQTVAKGPTGTRSMSTGSTNNVAGIMLSIKPTRSL